MKKYICDECNFGECLLIVEENDADCPLRCPYKMDYVKWKEVR